ncbi:MAG TPA: EamA family transporter [Nitrososphaeraceae archaeon]|nr:EamA family transporter [Nitrososphaeraceae archaeon]
MDHKIWLILIFTWIIIASTYLAIKISIDTIPPLLMSGIRYTISGLMLFFIFKIYSLEIFDNKKRKQKTEKIQTSIKQQQQQKKNKNSNLLQIISSRRKQWKDAIIIGISLIVAGQGSLAYGEQYLSSDITALLFSTVPIWVLLIGKFYYNLKLNKYTLLGIIAGSIGLVILIYPSFEDMLFVGGQTNSSTNTSNKNNFLGISILLIAAISWAIGSLYSHRADLPNNILISTGMMLFVGGLFLLGIGMIIEFNTLDVSRFSTSSILSLLYLIIVGTMGWLGFFWILRNTTATLANTFAYVSPVIAVFLGWIILDENINIRIIVATIVIIVGVILIVNKNKIVLRNNN